MLKHTYMYVWVYRCLYMYIDMCMHTHTHRRNTQENFWFNSTPWQTFLMRPKCRLFSSDLLNQGLALGFTLASETSGDDVPCLQARHSRGCFPWPWPAAIVEVHANTGVPQDWSRLAWGSISQSHHTHSRTYTCVKPLRSYFSKTSGILATANPMHKDKGGDIEMTQLWPKITAGSRGMTAV